MSQESLSALLDGECSPAELERLLSDLDGNPELKNAFSRICLSKDARDGVRVSRSQPCIVAGVMAGLDQAPGSDKVVSLESRRKPVRVEWKPLVGLAAAASFGALAVLVAMPQAPDAGLEAAPQGVVQTAGITPVAATALRKPRNLRAVALTADEQQQDEELRSYLMEHSNTLADRGMGGTLSYARFTAHTAEYRQPTESEPASEDRR